MWLKAKYWASTCILGLIWEVLSTHHIQGHQWEWYSAPLLIAPLHHLYLCPLAKPTFDNKLGSLLQHVSGIMLILSLALVQPGMLLCDVSNDQHQGDGVFVNALISKGTGDNLWGGVIPVQVVVDVLGGFARQLNVTSHNGSDLGLCLQTKWHI